MPCGQLSILHCKKTLVLFAFFIKLVVWSFQVMFMLLPSVGDYNDLVLVRVELHQPVYDFCNLQFIFVSAGELMFQYNK